MGEGGGGGVAERNPKAACVGHRPGMGPLPRTWAFIEKMASGEYRKESLLFVCIMQCPPVCWVQKVDYVQHTVQNRMRCCEKHGIPRIPAEVHALCSSTFASV